METDLGDDFSLTSPAYPHEAEGHLQVGQHDEQSLDVSVIFPDLLGTISAMQMAEGLAKRLDVLVIYTDEPGTRAALQMADALAQKLGAHIKLLMPYEVPYTLPLTKPAVAVEFLKGQIRNLACGTRLEVAAHIYLCRDKRRALELLLTPNSLIAVGGKKRWWPTAAQKLARDLQKVGHHVIFAEVTLPWLTWLTS